MQNELWPQHNETETMSEYDFRKGQRDSLAAELDVWSDLLKAGFSVSQASGMAYDLVAERCGIFYRVQVKSGTYFDGNRYTFKTRKCYRAESTKSSTYGDQTARKVRMKYTNKDADVFAFKVRDIPFVYYQAITCEHPTTASFSPQFFTKEASHVSMVSAFSLGGKESFSQQQPALATTRVNFLSVAPKP